MKRLLSIFLISILAMSLCGCFLFEATSTWDVMRNYFPSINENGDKFKG